MNSQSSEESMKEAKEILSKVILDFEVHDADGEMSLEPIAEALDKYKAEIAENYRQIKRGVSQIVPLMKEVEALKAQVKEKDQKLKSVRGNLKSGMLRCQFLPSWVEETFQIILEQIGEEE